MPILHLIASPFPSVWHTERDNLSALDPHTVRPLRAPRPPPPAVRCLGLRFVRDQGCCGGGDGRGGGGQVEDLALVLRAAVAELYGLSVA